MAEASIVRLLCHMVPEIYFLADETKLMKKDFIYICQLGKGRNLITNPSISEKCIHTYEQLVAKYNENLKWKTDRPDTNP